MSSKTKTMIIIQTLCLILMISTQSCTATPTHLFHVCQNATRLTVPSNATYRAALGRVLSSLSAAAALGLRHNATTDGDARGLFFCRADVGSDACTECVATAAADLPGFCRASRSVVAWYDECQLRYSDRAFFGRADYSPQYSLVSPTDFTGDREGFGRAVVAAVGGAAEDAANRGEKFGVRVADFEDGLIEKVYSLAQCSPDVSGSDCGTCLSNAAAMLPGCCDGKLGGRVLTPSCSVRYEVYPFLNATADISSATPISYPKERSNYSTLKTVAISVPIVVSIPLFMLGLYLLWRRVAAQKISTEQTDVEHNDEISSTIESLQFDFATIEAATNRFSAANKLGGGGFGEVFKGRLLDGREIAVKRLSKISCQGVGEFKNEVGLLAKLQHRNLVSLLGFCFKEEEKLLVYEYVPNKSLDGFLFDQENQRHLDWESRYRIIGGIARGILYLHEDSRLKVIHRDLKTSNILLDVEMNPKISDFGMARIFSTDQTRGSTSKVVGTYGYMAPEYAMRGEFSGKSDVYSFGVIVLEIISGRKNSSFNRSDGARDLLSYAWKLWMNGTPLELLDPTVKGSYSEQEVSRCVHIGLLCAQEDSEDRPTMASIVVMLNSYTITLPVPREPGFYEKEEHQSSREIVQV